ncbi:MAG: amino acid ABC transporter substrate-binding protein [Succinivibrio sp.]|nr:amino acid ABC transporter substrate-binding protein [Succinivibrio sp.]
MIKTNRAVGTALVMAALFLGYAAAAEETTDAQDQADEKTTLLKVAAEDYFPPFVYLDDSKHLTGFDVELLNAIGREEGFTCIYEIMDFKEIQPAVMQGRFDIGASAFAVNYERKQLVEMTNHYLVTSLSIVVDDFLEGTVSRLEDLDGKNVCVESGTYSETMAKARLKRAAVLTFNGSEALNQAFNDGQCQLLINEKLQNQYSLQTGALQHAVMMPDEFNSKQIAFIVPKNRPALLERINRGLEKIKENGTYDQIFMRWFKVDLRAQPDSSGEGGSYSVLMPDS